MSTHLIIICTTDKLPVHIKVRTTYTWHIWSNLQRCVQNSSCESCSRLGIAPFVHLELLQDILAILEFRQPGF